MNINKALLALALGLALTACSKDQAADTAASAGNLDLARPEPESRRGPVLVGQPLSGIVLVDRHP